MGSSGASSSSGGNGRSDAGADSGGADAGNGAGGDSGVADTGSGANTVTGMLGTTPLNPITSAYWINTSPGETIVYLIAGSVSCSQLATNGWLISIPSGTQVVELVMPSTTTTGMVSIPGGEANFGSGGMSSLTETSALSGTINVTKNDPMGAIEGTVSAMYAQGSIMGSFHADFCAGGMGY